LKRQKEQQRAARALAKRVAKQARRENRGNQAPEEEFDENALGDLMGIPNDAEAGTETETPTEGDDRASS